jgi:hypothetical protein
MKTEKKFFRVRLAGKCPANIKMVNGVTLTKQWQVKAWAIVDFTKFPDVEAQVMVKQGNGFVPAEEAPGGADDEADDSSDDTQAPLQPVGNLGANTGVPAEEATNAPDFASMTVEQLKGFLTANGVASSDLRNATKSELIERAEFIWSQNK